MKVSNENIDKLSQLDRIEFRQKIDAAEVNVDIGAMPWYILIICSIFLVNGYYEISETLIKLTFYVIIIKFFLIVVGGIINSKRRTEVAREYFKIETKKKK